MKFVLLGLLFAVSLAGQGHAAMCNQCKSEESPDKCLPGNVKDCGANDCVSWVGYRNGKPFYIRGCMVGKGDTCEQFGARYMANNQIYDGSYPFWCERCDYNNCNKCKMPKAKKPS